MNDNCKNKDGRRRAPLCRRLVLAAAILMGLLLALPAGAFEARFLPVSHVIDIKGDFNKPTEVAVSDKGHIFVLDGANHRVCVFSQSGKRLYEFGKPDGQAGEMDNPVGLCLDEQQRVYVADTGNRRVLVFDARGGYIRTIDLSPWNARPVEVAVSEKTERIYVSDGDNHQIICFDAGGAFIATWGAYGDRIGEFKFPGAAVVSGNGNLHVLDILNGRMQVFGPEGENPRQLSKLGVVPGTLYRPKGIAVNGQSRIFVSDSYTGIIQVFHPDGRLHGILSRGASELLRLTTPIGMAFDKDGRLYVVQSSLNTVSVFELGDKK